MAIEALAARRPLLVSDIDGVQDHAEKGAKAVKTKDGPERWQKAIEQVTSPRHTEATSLAQPKYNPEDIYAAAWSNVLDSL